MSTPLPLGALLDTDDPALPLLRRWAADAPHAVELLPAGPGADAALVAAQVTTRSTMGAVVHGTGGILVDDGWLRILGSGHERLRRTLPGWNEGRLAGALLVADDAVGGFFAVDAGGVGVEPGTVHYLAPDSLAWEPLGLGYSAWVHWALTGDVAGFFETLRWTGWRETVRGLHGDRALLGYPPPFTAEGRGDGVRRSEIPVEEMWAVQLGYRAAMGGGAAENLPGGEGGGG